MTNQVHNIERYDKHYLTLYFESQRSGGGKVVKLSIKDGYAIVQFESYAGEFLVMYLRNILQHFFGVQNALQYHAENTVADSRLVTKLLLIYNILTKNIKT